MEFSAAIEAEHDEVEIITRVRGGAKEDFRLLVLRHQERIYALIYRQVADENIARELTQDAFLRAYLHLDKFRGESRFGTWLTRIALNTTNSYFSSKRWRQRLQTVAFEQHHLNQQPVEHADDRYDEDAIARLYAAVSRLRPKIREAFVLCALEQKSYEQAAEILGIPIGTVRSRLHKARSELKKLYFAS